MKNLGLTLVFLVSLLAFSGVASADVFINEFMANPSSGNDWIELYANDTHDLTGWTINDSTGKIKDLSGTMNAGDFYVVEVDNRLNQDTDKIILLNSTSGVVDEIEYGSGKDVDAPGTDESAGRSLDGGSGLYVFESSQVTKGSANYDKVPPGEPTNIQSTVDLNKITWTWTEPVDNSGGVGLDYTEVWLNDVHKVDINAGEDAKYEATGLSQGTNYTIKLIAVDKNGNQGNAVENTVATLKESLDVTQSTVSISKRVSDSVQTATATFEVKNTGTADLTGIAFTLENLYLDWITDKEYADDNDLFISNDSVSFSPMSFDLAAGENKTVTATVAIPQDNDVDYFGTYVATVTAKSGSVSDTFELQVELQPEFDDGDLQIGDITIDEDRLFRGEQTDVTVEIKNRINKVMDNIKVYLEIPELDIKEEIKISEIDEKDTVDAEFTIEIPIDANEGRYNLYIYAEGEDEDNDDHSDYDVSENIRVEQDDHDVLVKLKADTTEVKPGDSLTIKATITNIGKRDEEDIYITLKCADLGYDKRTSIGDLKDGKDETVSFAVNIPSNAKPDIYLFDAEITYNDDDKQDNENHLTDSISITVKGEPVPSTTQIQPTRGVITGTTTVTAGAGELVKYTLTLLNKENSNVEYELRVTGYSDWATDATYEPAGKIGLSPSQSIPIYVYITPKEGVSGEKTATVSAYVGGTLVESKTLTAKLSERVATEGFEIRSFGRGVTAAGIADWKNNQIVAGTIAVVIAIIASAVIIGFSLRHKK